VGCLSGNDTSAVRYQQGSFRAGFFAGVQATWYNLSHQFFLLKNNADSRHKCGDQRGKCGDEDLPKLMKSIFSYLLTIIVIGYSRTLFIF
jgi:hypothetical protein